MKEVIKKTLYAIEMQLKEPITLLSLAEDAGYSPYHFAHQFRDCVGMAVMAYVTWRRLYHARYELSRGAKVIDIAMDYGFVTHAGFTKAFKRCFGHPPSLCALHLDIQKPGNPSLDEIHALLQGGITMQPHIIEWTPFIVAGWPSKHIMPGIRNPGDVPAYWDNIQLDYGPLLTKLHDLFPLSKHCEVSLCTDIDPQSGAFTYMLGRGIDVQEDIANIEPDMASVEVAADFMPYSQPPSWKKTNLYSRSGKHGIIY